MCEYCGCQSLTSIDQLTREHDTVVALISRVRTARRSGDTAAAAALARRIAAVLGPHTRVEEEGLFPALADDFPVQIAALTEEHRQIEAVLGEAEGGVPADPAWPDKLLAALADLREHILKEQDGVFPAALASLTTDQWEDVEAVRARAGSALSGPAA
ncbi:hemerythrin domain-containing protein [Streptomyces tagetis]|uniref:Hemerythrin domain-containing protein n=1 Tax=Streptomyces tagetis TaxID=2820809 RepID=A0A941B757_9ACTN|nr:hemerythrin domain-containing protein [Streptomyces sp. RG38]MBQ0827098.1 hemerythrin domain-containing protein [Streptomyces sp. RG38]